MPRASTAIYRFHFSGNALLPDGEPETVVAGLPRGGNHAIAFDDSGHLFVGLGAKSNACSPKPAPGTKPVGQKPCPDLADGGGIWRFAADRTGQTFADGNAGRHRHPLHDRDGLVTARRALRHHAWPRRHPCRLSRNRQRQQMMTPSAMRCIM